jgi:hypothetical protein
MQHNEYTEEDYYDYYDELSLFWEWYDPDENRPAGE